MVFNGAVLHNLKYLESFKIDYMYPSCLWIIQKFEWDIGIVNLTCYLHVTTIPFTYMYQILLFYFRIIKALWVGDIISSIYRVPMQNYVQHHPDTSPCAISLQTLLSSIGYNAPYFLRLFNAFSMPGLAVLAHKFLEYHKMIVSSIIHEFMQNISLNLYHSLKILNMNRLQSKLRKNMKIWLRYKAINVPTHLARPAHQKSAAP